MIIINSRALLLLLLLLLVSAPGVVAAKKKRVSPPTDTQRVLAAAGTCTRLKHGRYLEAPTPDKLKALIASGINISATDSNGFDALSNASLLRKVRYKGKADDWWTLSCPTLVTTLTEAGADPWKAKFYQNPHFNNGYRPKMIAVIRVEDKRDNKGNSEKLLAQMTDGVETRLGTGRYGLGYPVLPLSEVRQRLRTSGWSAEDTVAPDRLKACKALAVDSVFEESLEDFRSASIGVVSAAGTRMGFALTDCKTGELLWRSDRDYTLSEGWLIRGLAGALGAGGKIKGIILGVAGEPAVSFPAVGNKF